jgi:threonine synthase
MAEGLAIAQPVRGRRLLQAVRESKGTCVMVEEDEIRDARQEMASNGFYIEPTSATAVAALKHVSHLVKPQDTIVIPLTGSGLKGSPKLG